MPALYVAVVLLLYHEVWLGHRVLGWDCLEEYWPDLSFFAGSLRHGQLPLWNPYDRGGYPFYADPQPGMYYPVTWILVALGALLGKVGVWMVQVKALTHHVLAGVTLHLYLRSRKLSPCAAVAGGVAWIVSTPMIIHKASDLIWPMVWMPLVWIAIDRLVERAGEPGWWRRAAALAAAVGICGVAASPPGFFYALIPGVAYGAYRVLPAAWRARRDRAVILRLAASLLLAGLVTFCLLAITVIPGLAVAAESTRSVRTLEYSLSNALHAPAALRGLLSPTSGMVDVYGGVALIVLAVAGLAARGRATLFWFALAVFAMLLAFGGGTPLLPWLVTHVPGFGLFREANRYKLIAHLFLVIVAAYGVDALVARERRALVASLGAAAAAAAGVLIMRQVLKLPPAKWGAPVGYGVTFAALGVVALLAASSSLLRDARLRTAAAAGIVALGFVDVSTFATGFLHTLEAPPDDQEDRRFVDDLGGDVSRDWRVLDEFVMEQRPGSRLRVRDFRGYPSGDPIEDQRYHDVLARATRNPELLEAFNVRWVLHGPHHRNGLAKNFLTSPPGPAHFVALDAHRFEAKHAVPLVAWYGAVRVVADAPAALEALLADEDADGHRHAAIVEQRDATDELDALASDATAAGALVSYEQNNVEVSIDAPARGVVVLDEKIFPGWSVTVDGKEARALRVDYLLRGVVVDAGHHEIAWRFHPPRYRLYITLWAAAMIFLIVAYVWRSRRTSAASAATTIAPAAA
jgi:hypothetical protein